MKLLFFFGIILCSTLCKAQKIDLSNKDQIIDHLNKKEFTVGEYGKMLIKYDDYDKAFNALKFKVEFTPTSAEKKPKKVQLEVMIFENDGFYSPDYVKSFSLKTSGAYVNDKYNFPTNYYLFENGDLYYVDKPNLSMEDYIKSLTAGEFVKSPKSFLCK